MTLFTWMKEFYPVPADHEEALADPAGHSLRKWEGTSPDSLKKHNVKLRTPRGMRPRIADENGRMLEFDGNTCALCEAYYDDEHYLREMRCQRCPIYRFEGRPCDREYDEALKGNTAPMIRLLKKVKKAVDAGEITP